MGYSFHGFFVNSQEEKVIDAARLQWPFAKIKTISSPFAGIGIAGDNEYEDFNKTHEENQRLQNELASFSLKFPDATFVFIWVDCSGGDCVYDGYACKAGEIFFDNRETDSERFSQRFEDKKLRELVHYLGADLDGFSHFEPFTRGYFS